MAKETEVAERVVPSRSLEPGQIIPPGTHLPPGWTTVVMDTGLLQAWPMAIESHDPDARRKVLEVVDKAYAKLLPTKEVPDRKAPTGLRVNTPFRRMFRSVLSWGDSCPIVEISDPKAIQQDTPEFKFVTD